MFVAEALPLQVEVAASETAWLQWPVLGIPVGNQVSGSCTSPVARTEELVGTFFRSRRTVGRYIADRRRSSFGDL